MTQPGPLRPRPARVSRSFDLAAARSQRREVRNPILALPAAHWVRGVPPDARLLLADLLEDLARDAGQRAQDCWRRHKAPMAACWKACSVYARHLARVIRKGGGHVAR